MTLPLAQRTRVHLSTPELAEELGVDRSSSPLVERDPAALDAIVQHIQQRDDFFTFERYPWDNSTYWYPEGSPRERSQYFTVGNAINFRFWRLVDGALIPAGGLLDGKRLTGAMYMWRCLRRCLDTGQVPIFTATCLANLTEGQFDQVFADDTGANPLAVAKDDRLANLRDLGWQLERDWDGAFYNVLEASRGSLVDFVGYSGQFRAFDDPLLKLTMVNTILHLGSGITKFDSDPLPGIDYHLLKQLLRHGILAPQRATAEKLRRQQLLSAQEGYNLRRAALNAFIAISERTGLSGEILDNKWWWNRLKCRTSDPVCLDPQTAHECPFFGACRELTQLRMPLEETRYY